MSFLKCLHVYCLEAAILKLLRVKICMDLMECLLCDPQNCNAIFIKELWFLSYFVRPLLYYCDIRIANQTFPSVYPMIWFGDTFTSVIVTKFCCDWMYQFRLCTSCYFPFIVKQFTHKQSQHYSITAVLINIIACYWFY